MMGVAPMMKLCIVAKLKGFCKSVDFEFIEKEIILSGSESVRKNLLLAWKQSLGVLELQGN